MHGIFCLQAEQEGEHYVPPVDVENGAVSPRDTVEEVKVQQPVTATKFGWIKGVLVSTEWSHMYYHILPNNMP